MKTRYANLTFDALGAPHHGRNIAAANNMYMQMEHFLPAPPAGVNHCPEAMVQPLLFSQPGRQHQHFPEQGGVAGIHFLQ